VSASATSFTPVDEIPTLDIRSYKKDNVAFARDFGAAYRNFGFCAISGHGIDPELIEAAYAAFRKFFALPEAVKRHYHLAGAGGARGYTPFRIETAVGSRHPDLKEFWHVGREFEAGAERRDIEREAMSPNLWPSEIPQFRSAALALYRALDQLGALLLRAVAIDLGLDAHWFDDKIDRGNSILRPLHYPPLPGPSWPGENLIEHDGSLRSAAHQDINLITLLIGASDAGLQIRACDGRWLPITPPGDTIVVNAGDMLEHLSNGIYRSTAHRVANPRGAASARSRYSVPFFLHPNPDFRIATLPCCIDVARPNRYPQTLTAHEFLLQRLREIRLL